MAKQQIFERKNDKLSEYLASLEELLKKNRGSGLYEAYNVNPRAFRVGGQVVDPSGLGQDVMNDNLKYAPYDYSIIPMDAPLTQMGEFDQNALNFDNPSLDQVSGDLNSYQGLQQVVNELVSVPVSYTNDGGLLYSNGVVRYNDGTSRQATQVDVPQVIATFSNGSVLLDNGLFLDPNASVGRAYSGLSGLSDLIFGRQQTVTQPYGNINPIEPTPGNVNLGTDFRTKDLPSNFNFSFPFPVEVVGVTYDDGTRFGDKSGHQGYGNSLYLKLPNGSVIHLSHLSDMENFSVGNVVQAFDYIGTPGATGNTYGQHADVEYYNPQGQIDDPQNFWLNASDYVDVDKINQSLESGKETLKPEERQWLEDQQRFIEKDVQANPMYALGQPRPDFSQEQPQNVAQNLGQTVQNVGQNIQQAVQPMSPERQALGQGIAQAGQKAGLRELYASEVTSGELTPGEAVSYNIENVKPFQKLDPSGKSRIDLGASELARGDWEGAKTNFMDTVNRVGARVSKLPSQIANEIVKPAYADDGSERLAVETLGDNLKGAGQSIGQYVSEKTAQAGEGLDTLKDKVSNLFQKTPLMGLFQGQKQVGDAKGSTLIETGGQTSGTPQSDAFFKYGGADQYAQYLIDNAEQARGGALDTSLFKNEFFQDPNNVANVFGSTSQGNKATQLYKDYLNSQIKEGYNEPYRTELRQEGDTVYEYKIPVTEYWQNQYYKQLLGETPDVLKSDFSFDKFQMPTVNRSASAYKGDVPTQSKANPIFSSAAVDLFKKTGSKVGQLAGDILKSPAAVYQSSTPSMSYEVPQASKSIFATPASFSSASMPSVQKSVYKAPTLADYLAKGKTVAQYYAETGQQSTLDAINKASSTNKPIEVNEYGYAKQSIPANATPTQIALLKAQENPETSLGKPVGATVNWNDAGKSASLSNSAQASIKSGSSVKDWLQNLFKKIF